MMRGKSTARHRSCGLVHALAATLGAALGCGGSGPAVTPVAGVVTMGGEPVVDAAVMFLPVQGGRPAEDVTDAEGRFRLTTFRRGDGALLGEHRVSVTAFNQAPAVVDDEGREQYVPAGGRELEWLVPERYADATRSGIQIRVERGMDEVRIDLEP